MTGEVAHSIFDATRNHVSETCDEDNLEINHHEYIKDMQPKRLLEEYPEFRPIFGTTRAQNKLFYDWFKTTKRMAARDAGVKVPPTPKKGKKTPTPKKTPKRKGTPVPARVPPRTPPNAGASTARPVIILPHTPPPAPFAPHTPPPAGADPNLANLFYAQMGTMAGTVATLADTVNDQIAHQNDVNARQAQYNQQMVGRVTGIEADVSAQARTNAVQRQYNCINAHRVNNLVARVQILEQNRGVFPRSDDEEDV